jgi:hypothetical protein
MQRKKNTHIRWGKWPFPFTRNLAVALCLCVLLFKLLSDNISERTLMVLLPTLKTLFQQCGW